METIWFIIVALMITAYVILDGFDLGAGIAHFYVGKTTKERGGILQAIGPVWDGNEVWLLAAGGVLYFAFPVLYSAAFSGFYLPLMIVLWLLIFRGIGIELRHQLQNPIWENFWDFTFATASSLLAIFFGAALGNVIRGVPLNADGYFFEPLWTNWQVGQDNGILDWYTVLCGVVAYTALTVHGASYLAVKTENAMNLRSRKLAGFAWYLLVLVTIASLFATTYVQPTALKNFSNYPIGWLIPVVVIGSLIAFKYFHQKGNDKFMFLSSCGYLVGMLVGAVFSVYPNVLPASTGEKMNLTIYNASAGSYGLQIGLIWWSIGITIAIAYFVVLYRAFGGKIDLNSEH
jgi:cytochrome bd ubiquinol oxidase subunit II